MTAPAHAHDNQQGAAQRQRDVVPGWPDAWSAELGGVRWLARDEVARVMDEVARDDRAGLGDGGSPTRPGGSASAEP